MFPSHQILNILDVKDKCLLFVPKPVAVGVFITVCCVRACETLVGWEVMCCFQEACDHGCHGKICDRACRLDAAAELSLYQSECDVWSVAAAALTGLPAYPLLTWPFHPFCLFLHCSSTPGSVIPSASGSGDPIHRLKLSISPTNTHASVFSTFLHQGKRCHKLRVPVLFIPTLLRPFSTKLHTGSVKP